MADSDLRVPHINENISTDKGRSNDNWHRFFDQVASGTNSNKAAIDALESLQEVIDFTIESPDNQVYPLEINAPYGYTITQVDSFCESGSCTATIKIVATALGGGANSVSTTLQSKTHSSANVVAVGDATTVTVSSNSSCSRMRLMLWITRT